MIRVDFFWNETKMERRRLWIIESTTTVPVDKVCLDVPMTDPSKMVRYRLTYASRPTQFAGETRVCFFVQLRVAQRQRYLWRLFDPSAGWRARIAPPPIVTAGDLFYVLENIKETAVKYLESGLPTYRVNASVDRMQLIARRRIARERGTLPVSGLLPVRATRRYRPTYLQRKAAADVAVKKTHLEWLIKFQAELKTYDKKQ